MFKWAGRDPRMSKCEAGMSDDEVESGNTNSKD
jgi:hypothetical protein